MSAQQTSEWLEARLGCCTASNFSDVLAKGEGKMRKAYLRRVIAERLTGKPLDSWSNSHTDRGNEQEPMARLSYEAKSGYLVKEVGFIKHPVLMAGASPDGLIDHDGGIEIKSVIPTVQIETIEKGGYPTCHKAQIQGSLWITGREWWDFVSYSADLKEHLQLYIFRVERDEEFILILESEVIKFLKEVDDSYNKLMAWKP